MSKIFFDPTAIKNQKSYENGHILRVTSDEMSGLVSFSFSSLKLSKGGAQAPIWHPNAHKIGYCLQGTAYLSLRTPTSVEVLTVTEGDLFFIPQGYPHQIVNIGEQEVSLIFGFNHQKPNEMSFFQAIHSLSESVFSTTFHTSPDFFQNLIKTKERESIIHAPNGKNIPPFIASRFKFSLTSSTKVILTKGGYLQIGTKTNLPVLDGLGLLGFGLKPGGVVEPHWHTNAGEFVYIKKGSTRITVLSPDGSVDNLEVKAGQGAFAAASHFHNIENIGTDDVDVIAFFSHADPDFIGIGEVLGSYSNDTLGSLFNVTPQFFDHLKKPNGPLVIVPI